MLGKEETADVTRREWRERYWTAFVSSCRNISVWQLPTVVESRGGAFRGSVRAGEARAWSVKDVMGRMKNRCDDCGWGIRSAGPWYPDLPQQNVANRTVGLDLHCRWWRKQVRGDSPLGVVKNLECEGVEGGVLGAWESCWTAGAGEDCLLCFLCGCSLQQSRLCVDHPGRTM